MNPLNALIQAARPIIDVVYLLTALGTAIETLVIALLSLCHPHLNDRHVHPGFQDVLNAFVSISQMRSREPTVPSSPNKDVIIIV